MDRKSRISIAVLALSITIGLIPITAQQSAVPPNVGRQANSSQPPIPTTAPDSQKQQGQGRREGAPAANVNQQPQGNAPAVNQAPTDGNTTERREQGNQAEDEPSSQWRIDPAIISAISAAVSAVFAVLICLVYRGQWQTMNRQAEHMRDGLAATKQAAGAAQTSALMATQQLVLSMRARLDISLDFSAIQVGRAPGVYVRLRNFGGKPANLLSWDIVIDIASGQWPATPVYKPLSDWIPLYGRPLNNGTNGQLLVYYRPTPLTNAEFESLKVGILTTNGMKVRIYGVIRYEGGFQTIYRGGFAQQTITSHEFPSDATLYLTHPDVAGYQYDSEEKKNESQEHAS